MTKHNRKPPNPQDCLPIPGYEGLYVITRSGEVYNLLSRRTIRFTYSKAGYPRVGLSKAGLRKIYYTHRLLMLTWCPVENSENLEVNHIDGNKWNHTLSNLEWVSHRENIIHARQTLKAWE